MRNTPATRAWTCTAREGALLSAGGGRVAVPTGIAIAIPEGYAGFVQPRSGLALRHGVTCLNTPGLIDAGYRDEIRVLLVNTDPSIPFTVERGDRIAQLVIQKVEAVEWRRGRLARRFGSRPRRLGLDRSPLSGPAPRRGIVTPCPTTASSASD